MRLALGDGYVEAVRATWREVPETADYVMYWWNHAAELASADKIRGFGFVTTNSIRQKLNRRILERHLLQGKLGLLFAIPDHPWVTSEDGAAVRIAMTVAVPASSSGFLRQAVQEEPAGDEDYRVEFRDEAGLIRADLTVGANVVGAVPLRANSDLSCPGVKLHGSGFIVTREQASRLGLGETPGLERHIREYRNGRDLTDRPRGVLVIDLFDLPLEEVRERFPAVYQWLYDRGKPERDAKATYGPDAAQYAAKWWLFGKPRGTFRPALAGLPRYIATVETSKHRFFVFLDAAILPDNMLVNVAVDDAHFLGVLSSRIHVCWALATGGRLGVGNDPRYNKTRCFETFPFPACTDAQKQRIRDLGEQLDEHRKRQQAVHPKLTLTGMYNVLEKLRKGEPLTSKDKAIHEAGLVGVLKQIHDELDAAVADAYGWPVDLSDELSPRTLNSSSDGGGSRRTCGNGRHPKVWSQLHRPSLHNLSMLWSKRCGG
jgi:hypothetical protein